MIATRVTLLVLLLVALGFQWWKQSMLEEMDKFGIDFSQIRNKRIVITGGNSGLGFETALQLARAGGIVVLACRNQEKCALARIKIINEVSEGKVKCLPLELSSLQSVRDFMELYLREFSSIDILINNAGLSLHNRELSVDGLEMQMHANHLGHFLLTSLLFPHFNSEGRIINHSSSMHFLVYSKDSMIKDLMSESDYSLAMTYSKTKLANILFTFELNRRLLAVGNPKQLKVVAVHPGFTATNLQTEKFPLWEEINRYVAMKGPHGALAQIYAAADPRIEASNNSYFGAKYIGFGAPVASTVSWLAKDEELQRSLWEASEKLTHTSFPGL